MTQPARSCVTSVLSRSNRSSLCLALILSLALALGACSDGSIPGSDGEIGEQAEILWDRWGVPHIFAPDKAALFHAFGWAQMESHGDLILRLYGQARGRAAEYWGSEHLDSDRWVHINDIPARARRWVDAQEAEARGWLDAFASGINDYAAAHPERLGDSYDVVLPVTAADVLAHAQRVLNYTFVTNAGVVRNARFRLRAGSNTWAIAPSRSASGNAMLVANPHLPWGDLFLWYEAQHRTPGTNAYGATLVGMPSLGIAFNDHLGWSHTVNTIDAADLYELELADGGYRLDGEVLPFEERQVVLRIRGDDGTTERETLAVRSSVHGPVIAESDGRAIALRVAGLDAPAAFAQWVRMAEATDLSSFEAALQQMQLPMFTVMYADRDGNILHFYAGRVPVRPFGDWRFWGGLVPGAASNTLWDRVHAFEELPRVLNPESGWLQNANDPPWTTTFPRAIDPADYPQYLAPRGMGLRPQRSARMLVEDGSISFDELVAYKHSTRMELADRIVDDLVGVARGSQDPRLIAAAEVLERWDRTADADSRGGVLFAAWFARMSRGRSRTFARPWDPATPLATPAGLANVDAALAALAAAAAETESTHGAIDVAWGEAHRFRLGAHDFPANGGPGGLGIFRVVNYSQSGDGRLRATGGDSFVAAIEFGDPIRARTLIGYGNATQSHSEHVGDQLALAARKELRPVWRSRAEVEANLERRAVPKRSGR